MTTFSWPGPEWNESMLRSTAYWTGLVLSINGRDWPDWLFICKPKYNETPVRIVPMITKGIRHFKRAGEHFLKQQPSRPWWEYRLNSSYFEYLVLSSSGFWVIEFEEDSILIDSSPLSSLKLELFSFRPNPELISNKFCYDGAFARCTPPTTEREVVAPKLYEIETSGIVFTFLVRWQCSEHFSTLRL